MGWEHIIGHQEQIAALVRLIKTGREPHALLLIGSAGIGKGSVAAAWAAALLCQDDNHRPCGRCNACRQLAAKNHPDYVCFENDQSSIKIEPLRRLQSEAARVPVMGGYRVVLIEDAERLTLPAANSLLKILEEPSPRLAFVLTAVSEHSLLTTVVSRCQRLQLQPVSGAALAAALVARGHTKDNADRAARLSGGRLNKALAFLAPDGLVVREQAVAVLRHVAPERTLLSWNQLLQLDGIQAEAMAEIVKQLVLLLRDVLLLTTGCDTRLLFNPDIKQQLSELANTWTTEQTSQSLTVAMSTAAAFSGNANARLLSEALLLRLGEIAVSAGKNQRR